MGIRDSQFWKSIFRHGPPTTARNRAMVMLANVFLHLHPVRARSSGIRLSFTWCMGGLTFFLFLVESITGILLMFYYRPVAASAYICSITSIPKRCSPRFITSAVSRQSWRREERSGSAEGRTGQLS